MTLDTLNILVVEPSAFQRHVIGRELVALGVRQFRLYSDGNKALAGMQQERPDAVMSSMHLPDMTGTELVTTMRKSAELKDITFLLVSAETHYRYLEPIRQAGAIAILPKPFHSTELRIALQSTLLYVNDSTSNGASPSFEQIRILLVDDSALSRRYLSQLLDNLGLHEIVEAQDGVEALKILWNQNFDLIITDYNMPNIDGEELVSLIRKGERSASVPVLMVTSEQDHSRLAAIQSAGVSAICNKPFGYDTAKQLIQQLVLAQPS